MSKRLPAQLVFFCILGLIFSYFIPQETVSAGVFPGSETVVEVTEGRILHSQNGQTPLPMASTTKILTAIIIIEDCNLDAVISVPKEAVGIEGSSIYLLEGEKLTVKDLLYGLMLRSGNDCAVALALHHSDSVENFAQCMNERAVKIGADHSHFINPHGLPAKGHFTTSEDLAMIAAYSLRNPEFSKIVSSKSYKVYNQNGEITRVFVNKNKMLQSYNGADGVKTGYTKEAGSCLVTSATRNGMRLVSVVLNCSDKYNRSAKILDDCFEDYSMVHIFKNHIISIKTDVRDKICQCKAEHEIFYPLKESERKKIRIVQQLPAFVRLPIKKDEEIGKIKIYLKNQLLFSQKIVSIEKVEKSFFDILQEITQRTDKKCESTNTLLNAELQADVLQIL